jgi:hypothetical protein
LDSQLFWPRAERSVSPWIEIEDIDSDAADLSILHESDESNGIAIEITAASLSTAGIKRLRKRIL